MEVLLHPVVRYWAAGAFVLLVAAIVAIHTTHQLLAATIAGLGLGLILGVTQRSGVSASGTEIATEPSGLAVGLNDVVGALELPAVALDAGQTILGFNAPAADLFAAIDTGVPLSRLSRHPGLIEMLNAIAADGLQRSIEIVDHLPNGRRLRVSGAMLQLRPDNPGIILLQFRDLSEQDRLAQMRSDFIANASHELRTPLASMRGFIETLQGPASADETARTRFLDIMSAQAARMTRILDDLLSLSRIEMKAHVPPTGQVDLRDLVREVMLGLELLATDAGITLNLDIPDGNFIVRGDRDELIQVFQNLVQNAIKYGHDGGSVVMAFTREEGGQRHRPRVRVAVRDDGPGIAAEHLPRLTERFYRVDTAASRARGGTGLGLAIVKHILNRHRGDLRIVSEVGKGSTFTVVLDLADHSPNLDQKN